MKKCEGGWVLLKAQSKLKGPYFSKISAFTEQCDYRETQITGQLAYSKIKKFDVIKEQLSHALQRECSIFWLNKIFDLLVDQ